MNNVELINELSAAEHTELIELVGWRSYSKERVEQAIKNSMYVVKAVVNGKTVGMGRLVGDFGCHGFLTDIIVNPEYQGMGIGKKIVLNIKEFAYNYINSGERFMIEFCPTSGNRDFYIKCGFKYKPEVLDGMYLWIEK